MEFTKNMDFLDPRKKRSHLIRLYIGYVLIAIAIAFGSLILLFAAFGYGVDKHGKVVLNGLLFVDSTPSGANVQVTGLSNNQSRQATTGARLTLQAGQYETTIIKKDYRTWQKTISLDGTSVERVDYPFLFPAKLVTQNLKAYKAQPSLITLSPDRHWVIVGQPGNNLAFDQFDGNDPTKPATTFSLPTGLLSAGSKSKIELVEWSTDNNHFLLKHSFSDKSEFIVVDRNVPSKSLNLNTFFKINPDKVVLHNKQYDRFYLYFNKGGVLEQATSKSKTLTPILTNVLDFKPHGEDMLEYISSKNQQKTSKVSVYLRTKDTDYLLRTLPANTSYVLNLAQYSGHWYVAAGAKNDDKVYLYKDPLDSFNNGASNTDVTARTLRITNPEEAAFSATAQFIAVRGDQKFSVYDAEHDRIYYFKIKQPLDSTKVNWMDGDRLTSISNGKVLIFEFDGQNVNQLNDAVPGFSPQFNREYDGLFALSGAKQGLVLTRTELRVK